MMRMAFHDIPDSALWDGFLDQPTFLMGDICCGTGSFLVGGLAEMKRRVLQSSSYDLNQQLAWLQRLRARKSITSRIGQTGPGFDRGRIV